MSTDYRPVTAIRVSDLFDGCLEECHIRESTRPVKPCPNARCLSDGENGLWVFPDEEGFVSVFTRYAVDKPDQILNAIASVFNTKIVSEYDRDFWEADYLQEQYTVMDPFIDEEDDHFYTELMKFLRGEPCDISPGTARMERAEFAKRLVGLAPQLATPAYRTTLLEEIVRIYPRDHTLGKNMLEAEFAAIKNAVGKNFDRVVYYWLVERGPTP